MRVIGSGGGAGSNRRPWGYESLSRQKPKYLPFLKLQPPRKFNHLTFFPFGTVPYTSCAVYSGHKLATNLWGESPSVETVFKSPVVLPAGRHVRVRRASEKDLVRRHRDIGPST